MDINYLPLWCRGLDEVLEIQPNLRKNLKTGNYEMLVEKDGKQWWTKCEIDFNKKIVFCYENRKKYDLRNGKTTTKLMEV